MCWLAKVVEALSWLLVCCGLWSKVGPGERRHLLTQGRLVFECSMAGHWVSAGLLERFNSALACVEAVIAAYGKGQCVLLPRP